jgi:YVTN family beta-propeller protein
MNNSLGIVNLASGKLEGEIAVGVAPYGIALSKDRSLAYVTNWGGRRAKTGEKTAKSGGTNTLIDERGIAKSGTVSVVDLKERKAVAEIAVGLHPADIKMNRAGTRLYLANANSDTVSVIDVGARKVVETILVRPDASLPFGSASNAMCLSADERTMFVACGGNNAVAVVRLGEGGPSAVEGFIPAGWYPGAVATDGKHVYVANVKGVGSRGASTQPAKGWGVKQYLGTVTKVEVPAKDRLDGYTAQVMSDARVPQSLAAWERGQEGVKATPVPQRVGEPSVFEHVVYVIKENRTYDQVLGDMGKGNGDPRLCVFGKEITPNHHALAEQFVLLDNYYCNGVLSADGHAWATEGVAVDYLEKAFGGFNRSYPFAGDDPLAFASSGFIWDNALLHGLSFRNYGEMSDVRLPKDTKWMDVYQDWKSGAPKIKLTQAMANESLRRYSCPTYPGWNLNVADAVRIDVFLKEFEAAKAKGEWPNLVIVYLPSDHTSGTKEGSPTPAAQVADNDLALGKLVDAVSHSKFWAKTCIFVIEDDPQAGFDHVDGHRSLCLVVSPYTKRGQVVSKFYNQTSVLHTMELMLGLPPMNQFDAMAPAMRECFTETADLRPYKGLPNKVPLDQMNPKKGDLKGAAEEQARLSEGLDLSEPDRADEDVLNRILWHAMRGVDVRYPAEFAGAHGKGLKGLKLVPVKDDDDDDDDRK